MVVLLTLLRLVFGREVVEVSFRELDLGGCLEVLQQAVLRGAKVARERRE